MCLPEFMELPFNATTSFREERLITIKKKKRMGRKRINQESELI